MSGRDEIDWAPRVPKEKIRRLYLSDAQGLLDEELLDDVGSALYQRCLGILAIDEAKKGQVHCPRCQKMGRDTIIHRERVHNRLEISLTCTVCGWQVDWRDYMRSFKRRQLNLGGAGSAFTGFTCDWPCAREPEAKMLSVDRLLHAFHYSFQQRLDMPSRPVGVNLINGKLADVISFLDDLSSGPGSTPGVARDRKKWEETLTAYRTEFLGKWCKQADGQAIETSGEAKNE